MMIRIKQSIFITALIVLACFGSAQAQRPSAADRVAREKQNVYAKLTDLSKDQKE
jgi:outer membrane lipoprotein-sorting protein